MKHPTLLVALVSLSVLFSSCVTPRSEQVLRTEKGQVELRSVQSRAFDTDDREMVMRTIIATMQDLDFLIDKADVTLGTVTGTKFAKNTPLKMTVSVRPRGASQQLVRASAQFGLREIADAGPYQDFFNALEKSLFLTAQAVD